MTNVYDQMILELKKRSESIRQNKEQFLGVPYELKSLLYFGGMTEKIFEKFYKRLEE